jgi:hypothetical protein
MSDLDLVEEQHVREYRTLVAGYRVRQFSDGYLSATADRSGADKALQYVAMSPRCVHPAEWPVRTLGADELEGM